MIRYEIKQIMPARPDQWAGKLDVRPKPAADVVPVAYFALIVQVEDGETLDTKVIPVPLWANLYDLDNKDLFKADFLLIHADNILAAAQSFNTDGVFCPECRQEIKEPKIQGQMAFYQCCLP